MVNATPYVGQRVILLINARGAYSVTYENIFPLTSLVMAADIDGTDDETVTVSNIDVYSDGLFDAEHTSGRPTIKGGQIDKRWIIAIFDDFEEE